MERVIYSGPDFCAAAEDGTLVEYIRRDTAGQCGDILMGTVERIMPGIGSAFVDIGRKNAGFLPLRENSGTFTGEELKSGMKIPVQIRKEEIGGKGAFLTRDLAIAGTTAIRMPMNRYIGVSNRITDPGQRERLREQGKSIAGDAGGIVMRAASLEAPPEAVAAEARELKEQWEAIARKIRDGAENGSILYHADPAEQMIAEYRAAGTAAVTEAETLPPDLKRQLRESAERRIRTGNGGNIVIDRCEAMTVIDVNSGSARADGKYEAAYMETNLSACETIAAQIRLRNIGGIILIDFIDLRTDAERERVAEKMRETLAKDRRKTVIHGWTRLGIMEMTRKRTD